MKMEKIFTFKNMMITASCAISIFSLSGCSGLSTRDSGGSHSDMIPAVQAAAQKDCGCSQCAAKGCSPCHGKNCYYCVAKALVTKECGCGACSREGCVMCGPGCDVCKFHLAYSPQDKGQEKKS